MLVSVIPRSQHVKFHLDDPVAEVLASQSALGHAVVSLAKYAAVYTRSWAPDGPNVRVRLRAERDRHQEDNALLREEFRIKNARMASIPAR